MLRELRVRNFAIIDELALSFSGGLVALTGETGAGKSIIAGSLGLALGGRASNELIKSGRDEATVEASFDTANHPVLDAMGIDSSDGIIIRRVLSAGGKSRAYVNGAMVTVQTLAALGDTLVDFHSQHEHQSLLDPAMQLQIIDTFGVLGPERDQFAAMHAEIAELKKHMDALTKDALQRQRRVDLLGFQIGEITSVGLREGEDRELDEERAILANTGRLREHAEAAYDSLNVMEGSGVERIESAAAAIREMVAFDSSVEGILKSLEDALPLIEDAVHELRSAREKYQPDPERLNEVEERRDTIRALKKKYGETIEEILAFRDAAKVELQMLEHAEENAAGLDVELARKQEQLTRLGARLTEGRRRAARKIEQSITPILRALALERATFGVHINPAAPSAMGMDAAELYFSANAGEPAKQLAKVASGGELSRIMLALKCVLREASEVPVLVFDEVDAGIGGATAISVAERLKELSSSHQVICITHLAQIASIADAHFMIEKSMDKGAVSVSVTELRGRARQEEIARMLGGTVTDASMSHAKEIMK